MTAKRTLEERNALRAIRRQQALEYDRESRRAPGFSGNYAKTSESQYDSESVAGEARGAILVGHHIGNGAKWIRRDGRE